MSAGWLRAFTTHSGGAERQASALPPLRVASRGMCCSVGHNARAATAAIRARMNHFRETDFLAPNGKPMMGAALYEVEQWGAVRSKAMFEAVLKESLAPFGGVASEDIALLLLLPEEDRPGASIGWAEFATLKGLRLPGASYHPESSLLPLGKAGIGTAVQLAQNLFGRSMTPPRLVVLIAVDTYFTAATIAHYLRHDRVKSADNPDGFTPGEAAAAIVLTPTPGRSPALWIEGAATADEPAPLGADAPCRAAGLKQAIRGAAQAAQCEVANLAFHASGVSGESWYFREASLAVTQSLERRIESFPHEIIARSVGETGAAAPVLTLAWLADVMGRDDGPGAGGLLHFANDNSLRSALVVRHRV